MTKRIEATIVDFIAERSRIPRKELTSETAVYDSSALSSLDLLDLISMIENSYAIVVEPEDLCEDNFGDVNTIANYVETKMLA